MGSRNLPVEINRETILEPPSPLKHPYRCFKIILTLPESSQVLSDEAVVLGVQLLTQWSSAGINRLRKLRQC